MVGKGGVWGGWVDGERGVVCGGKQENPPIKVGY